MTPRLRSVLAGWVVTGLLLGVLVACACNAEAPAKDVSVKNTEVQQGVHALARMIVGYAMDADNGYPRAVYVTRDGLGEYPLDYSWPRNPFTGRPMRPGRQPGDYVYRPMGDGPMPVYFTLVGYGSDSNGKPIVVVRAGFDETTFRSILQLRHAVVAWAHAHGGRYPSQAFLGAQGLGRQTEYLREPGWVWRRWPTNPYTNQPMRAGTQPGDFRYQQLDGGKSFSLVGYDEHGQPTIKAELP